MKRKKYFALLALAAQAAAAVVAVSAEEAGTAITTETSDYRNLSEEGTVILGDGYSMEVAWCGEEGKRVFGRIYYPEDFSVEEQYTTVVLNHGGGVNADFWDRFYAPELARAGYVCYAFDCRSATEGGRGSFGDPTEDGTCSVATYSEDLNAALDLMEGMSYVDPGQVYVMGQSMGGATVQNVASQRSEEIAGMVVLYGSVSEDNKSMLPDYDAVAEHPYDNGEVLFVQGAQDASLPIDRTRANMEWYEECSLIYINEAYHGFGVQDDRPANICVEAVIDYLKRNEAKTDEMPGNPTVSTADDLIADEEGYTVTGDAYSFTVAYCGEEGSRVFGRLYRPADFDESQTYTTLLLLHGGNGNCDSWDKVYAPLIAEKGYLVYTIDCRSEASGGRGSYGDPVPDGKATVETYSQDAMAALDYLESLPYVDKGALYIGGGSFGGAAAQVTASKRSDEIAGLIVLQGSLSEDNGPSMYPDYETIKANPYSNGEVLFVQGTEDKQCILERTLENMEWYPQCSLTAISKTGHGYGFQMDRSTLTSIESMTEFLARTSAEGGGEP